MTSIDSVNTYSKNWTDLQILTAQAAAQAAIHNVVLPQ